MFSNFSLGKKIKLIRSAKGISQENIAQALKCNQSTIQRIEQGKSECGAETLAAIKKYLEIENAPLLGHELEIFKERLLAWGDLISNQRIAEAKAAHTELQVITHLPYEHDLLVMFLSIEALMLIVESNLTAAKESLNAAKALLNDTTNDRASYTFHVGKGSYHFAKTDNPKGALKHFLCAEAYKSKGIKPSASVYTNIASLYVVANKPHLALNMVASAEVASGDNPSPLSRINTYIMYSSCHIALREYEKAKHYINIALTSATSINFEAAIGWSLAGLGLCASKTGNYQEGITLFDQALVYFRKDNSLLALSRAKITLYHKGLTFFLMKNMTECQATAEEGLQISEDDAPAQMCFGLLKHLTTLDNNSADYIFNDVIPYLKATLHNKEIILDILMLLEQHYKNKRNKTKANAIAAEMRDIYHKMFFGEVEF